MMLDVNRSNDVDVGKATTMTRAGPPSAERPRAVGLYRAGRRLAARPSRRPGVSAHSGYDPSRVSAALSVPDHVAQALTRGRSERSQCTQLSSRDWSCAPIRCQRLARSYTARRLAAARSWSRERLSVRTQPRSGSDAAPRRTRRSSLRAEQPSGPCWLSAAAIPRRSMCDGVAGDALETTRLRRVLHCVPVPGAKQASLGMPQASARHISAHAGGG